MTKYRHLLDEYAEDIATIKVAQQKEEEARQRYNKWVESQTTDNYDYATEAELAAKWDEEDLNVGILCSKLSQDIEVEYSDVPFAKPRKQGVEKFWELSGI